MGSTGNEASILKVAKSEQYRTVDELFEKSRPSSVYYTLLVLSSLIVGAGVLLNKPAIVIGGMLVTPVLSPLLLLALGLAIGEKGPIYHGSYIGLQSIVIVVLTTTVMALLVGDNGDIYEFADTTRTAILYFIVASAGGAAATFGWARRDFADVLPGVAIAVSLVPPLSIVGVGLSTLSEAVIRSHLFIFFFNLLGILLGSVIVFSLLRFDRSRREVQEQANNQEGNHRWFKRFRLWH